MIGCMCAECKYAKKVRDNHKKFILICVCRESENFLHELEIASDNCDFGFVDDEEEDASDEVFRLPT